MRKLSILVLLAALLLCSCSTLDQSSSLYVKKIEGLADDFLMGADVSSLVSLEESGVVFHDFGSNPDDLLSILKDAGVNCFRIRLWNDPYDSEGRGYGGGNCDIENLVAIGKRATAIGVPLMVDFHYSDFWADPSKQQAPKAWASMGMDEKESAIYDYTTDVLKRLKDEKILVKIVQIGNETTTGLCSETSTPRVLRLLRSASKAVRDFDPEIRIAVHYTNPESGKYGLYAAQLKVNEVDYDIFATSYYPYWHSTLQNLSKQLEDVASRYGKAVMVAETSYAYTLDDSDGQPNTIGEELTYEKSYPISVQGQSAEIADVIRTVASLGSAGAGVFYWEPAWIAVPGDSYEERFAKWEEFGSGWASSASASYDPDDAGKYYGGCACDNQALFDSDGMPLESLRTFSLVRTGNEVPVAVDCLDDVYVQTLRNNPVVLPAAVDAVYNDGSKVQVAVNWDTDIDLEAISCSPVGTYEVTGKADGKTVSCFVSIVDENYMGNYSFESGDNSMWKIENFASLPQSDFQVKKTDAFTGETSLHFWNENKLDFQVSQTATGLRSGLYRFSVEVQGGDVPKGAVMMIFAESDGKRYEQSFTLDGWRVWQNPVIENIACNGSEIKAGVLIQSGGGAWGTIDDFLLNPME
ncbi:MAG: glycosyl hydrolase 53 family protein [Sphaerochaetaceae bacterium]|nr:glycosyl hydrolase 53 family protein [Sphaerochaetaceae bacterium]